VKHYLKLYKSTNLKKLKENSDKSTKNIQKEHYKNKKYGKSNKEIKNAKLFKQILNN